MAAVAEDFILMGADDKCRCSVGSPRRTRPSRPVSLSRLPDMLLGFLVRQQAALENAGL